MLESKTPAKSLNIDRIRPFLLPGGIILVVLVSGLLLLRPRIEKIALLQRGLKQKEKRLVQLAAKKTSLEGLDQAELSSRSEIMAKVFPSEKDFPLVVFVLKKLTERNNLEITSLQVSPGEIATVSAQPKKGPPLLSFTIEISGQMSNLKEFLTQVTKTAPLMILHQVEFNLVEGGTALAKLTLESPFLSLPATLGRAEQPLSQITPQEEKILQELSQFDLSLIEEETPTVISGKEDPFSL